ncbi:hypothetical protein Tco_0819317 [Tanacetum coccineum]|uniref:Uncharacterized protein n=1 Tax=Tanacetum coccineum TaxID=301880 RepID=A0ABQ5A762_9ASTR
MLLGAKNGAADDCGDRKIYHKRAVWTKWGCTSLVAARKCLVTRWRASRLAEWSLTYFHLQALWGAAVTRLDYSASARYTGRHSTATSSGWMYRRRLPLRSFCPHKEHCHMYATKSKGKSLDRPKAQLG